MWTRVQSQNGHRLCNFVFPTSKTPTLSIATGISRLCCMLWSIVNRILGQFDDSAVITEQFHFLNSYHIKFHKKMLKVNRFLGGLIQSHILSGRECGSWLLSRSMSRSFRSIWRQIQCKIYCLNSWLNWHHSLWGISLSSWMITRRF